MQLYLVIDSFGQKAGNLGSSKNFDQPLLDFVQVTELESIELECNLTASISSQWKHIVKVCCEENKKTLIRVFGMEII